MLRPLFITSFLIDDFLARNQIFGAQQIILSSASGKTAFGTAHWLALRRSQPSEPKIIAQTSASNIEFVRSLGCYDEVHLYKEVPNNAAKIPTVYDNFAVNATLRRTIHT